MKTPHFGHHVWNAASAWGHILPTFRDQSALHISWTEDAFIGRPKDLFPEIAGKTNLVLHHHRDLTALICERRALVALKWALAADRADPRMHGDSLTRAE